MVRQVSAGSRSGGFEGKSYQRTAELCDCSVGTVKSRLHRARHQLHMIVDG
ncbi:hypothetical protein HGG75_24355 [Ochrobactrum pseudogrignonense]|nr:hypothetical protein [Brucella pseudogrignonensis]